MAEDAQLLTAVLAAIRRRPLTMFYAVLLTKHLAFAIDREADYPSSPKLHEPSTLSHGAVPQATADEDSQQEASREIPAKICAAKILPKILRKI
jgi:hypothetical protein